MKFLLYLLLFFLLGAFIIISNENLHLSNHAEASRLYSAYYSWLGGLGSNIKGITGEVVSLNWFPKENSQKNQSS